MGQLKQAYIFFTLLLLMSCNPPVVTEKLPTHLIVASDFLTAKDSVIFRDFVKETGITIKVVHMTTDSILQHHEILSHNAKFNVVLLKSSYSINQLAHASVLHPVAEFEELNQPNLTASNLEWIALGIDPYIIANSGNNKTMHYNDLTFGTKWKKTLDNSDLAAFQASVMHQFGRSNRDNSLKWLEKIDSQSMLKTDSTTVDNYYLAKLSSVDRSKTNFVYPNQSKRIGAFYDAYIFGIRRHDSKYTTGVKFAHYYLNLVHNQKLCNALNVLPVANPLGISSYAYQNDYPELNRCNPKEAVALYRDLEKIRARMDANKKIPATTSEDSVFVE